MDPKDSIFEHQEFSSDKSSGAEKPVALKYDVSTIELGGVEERKLIRKLDLHIIPSVMLVYTLSFLDR